MLIRVEHVHLNSFITSGPGFLATGLIYSTCVLIIIISRTISDI